MVDKNYCLMGKDIEEILITEDQIRQRIREMGQQIKQDYMDKDLLTVCILRGAVMFYCDLVKEIDLPLTMNFMAVSSYGNASHSSGMVRIQYDLQQNIQGKDVLIVEDIVDSGHTLTHLTKLLSSRNPKSLKVCTLLDKPERREVPFEADYVGFEVPDKFVVGYGLDYAEKYRTYKHIGILKPHIYTD